ncbi:MAG: outer membrane protein assembly factor BamC [Nitrosomonadales bacterium]|nr:outer membrane protein assembly factor BamC [Nitrosomonadales bacterium]
MQVRNIAVGFVAVSLLAGCSIFERKQVDYKAGAVQTQALEVPPDLTVPETDQRYTIPGTDGEKVANYSEYTKKKTEQPCVNPAPVEAAVAPMANAKLQDNKGVKRIQLGEPFDRSWRRIGLALEKARIAVTDKDRNKGIYFISIPAKDKAADYQVTVRETREGSEAAVVNAAGKNDAETARLVETVYQNLEEKEPSYGMPQSDG